MQIKKLFKYLPITMMTAGLILATTVTPPYLLKNNDHETNLVEQNINQESIDTDQIDPIEYIRNDVIKQTGDPTVIESIELANGSSRSSHSAAIVNKKDGSTLLYMWGQNDVGQLGLGPDITTSQPTPQPVTIPGNISQISLGAYHSAAIADGKLYTWGSPKYGNLGLGEEIKENQPTPQPVTMPGNVSQVALGFSHSAATVDGKLYTWGSRSNGQLGLGPDIIGTQWTPQPVTIPGNVSQISLSSAHSAAIADGSLYTWGLNRFGQLGLGPDKTGDQWTPQPVTIPGNISQISLGAYHSAAILEDGSLYTWGRNDVGQLGLGPDIIDPQWTPQPVTIPGNISQISLGTDHSAATVDGKLYTWGSRSNGQLGLGPDIIDNQWTPQPVIIPGNVSQISLSSSHSAAIADGSLYTWGYNAYGQLGLGDSGSATNRDAPTHMPYLGKDSHIEANPLLTALEAVNKIWINEKFSLTGFKENFALTNLPDVAGKPITMASKPEFNNDDGTVTMTISIPNYYDENGYWVEDTTAKPMVIGGFFKSLTSITAKATYNQDIVVDKWEDIMKDGNGNYDHTKLSQYLTLTKVPEDAKFTITVTDPGHKTGILKFNIVSDKITLEGDIVKNIESDSFPITLNLTPRITVMTPITTGYPAALPADVLKDKLFGNGTTIITNAYLEPYMTVKAPVDDVNYHLVDNSWISQPGDGTVTFKIYADKYYDSEGDLQTGSPTTAASVVNFNLKLQPEASSIEVLSTPLKEIRVDKFEAYIKQSDNALVRTRLAEFLDLKNVPTDAQFTINTVTLGDYDANFIRNQLTLNLTIDKFNQGSPATPQPYTETLTLTLEGQHAPTAVGQKLDYNQNIDIRTFYSLFVDENNVVTDLDFLNGFVSIESLPVGAKLTLVDIVTDEYQGTTEFKIKTDNYYDALSNDGGEYTFPGVMKFQLLAKKRTLTVTKATTVVPPIKVDEFISQINTLSNTPALQNYLFNDYLIMSGDLPPDAVFSVSETIADTTSGIATFNLAVSVHYDASGDLQNSSYPLGEFKIQLQFQPSKIIQIKTEDLTVRVDKFIDHLKDGNQTLSIDQLKNYFALENISSTAVFTIAGDPIYGNYNENFVRSTISFKIHISEFNQADNTRTEHTTSSFTFKLGEQHQPTNIKLINYDSSLGVGAVVNQLKTLNGTELVTYLKNFVVFESVPTDADITVAITSSDEATGKVSIQITANKKYDESSKPVDTPYVSPVFNLTLGETHEPTVIAVKPGYTKTRIDEFVTNVTNKPGQFIYDYLYNGNYITATTGIDTGNLKTKILDQNNHTGDLKLEVIIPSYYNENKELVKAPKSFELDYQLTPKYNQTQMELLTSYPQNINVKEFKEAFSFKDTGGELNSNDLDFLSRFIWLQSVPPNTTTSLTWKTDPSDQQVSFTITLDQHYTAAGEPGGELTKDFILDISAVPSDPEQTPTFTPTKIQTKPNAPWIKSSTDFLDTVLVNGVVDFSKLDSYVDGLNTLPALAKITALTAASETTQNINFDLVVDQYYDEQGKLASQSQTYSFQLNVIQKQTPTNITTLAQGAYPTDLIGAEFKAKVTIGLNAQNQINAETIDFLGKFLSLSTVPKNTTFTLIWITGLPTNQVGFNLMVNQYYDDEEYLQNNSKWFNDLILTLASEQSSVHTSTELTLKADAPAVPSVEALNDMIKTEDNNPDFNQLSQFVVGLGTIPSESIIKIEAKLNEKGECVLEITVDSYYNEQGVFTEENKTYPFIIELQKTPVVTPEIESETFPWWWILVGVGAAALIGVGIWLVIKKTKKTVIY